MRGPGDPAMTSTMLMRRLMLGAGDLVEFSARGLVLMCALNVNGVLDMTLSVGAAASLLLLAGALLVIAHHGRLAWSTPFTLIFAAIVLYLVFGALIEDWYYVDKPFAEYIRTYVATLLLLWAFAGYTASLGHGARLTLFLRFVRNVFLVAAASIWASPLLYKVYVNLPPSHFERMGGFFQNPNEAGLASCMALVMTLAVPFRRLPLQAVAFVVALGGVALTLSKTSMTVTIVVIGWHLIRHLTWRTVLAGAIVAAVVVPAALQLMPAADGLDSSMKLGAHQKNRIAAVGQILTGNIDSETTTGRTELWSIGISRALSNFPLGYGLGSYHFMKDGIPEGSIWLGVHNTFLMFWGEAGVLVGLLFLGGFMTLARHSLVYARGGIELPAVVVLFGDMMSSHGALEVRYGNLILGLILGLVGYAAWRSRESEARVVTRAARRRRFGPGAVVQRG